MKKSLRNRIDTYSRNAAQLKTDIISEIVGKLRLLTGIDSTFRCWWFRIFVTNVIDAPELGDRSIVDGIDITDNGTLYLLYEKNNREESMEAMELGVEKLAEILETVEEIMAGNGRDPFRKEIIPGNRYLICDLFPNNGDEEQDN